MNMYVATRLAESIYRVSNTGCCCHIAIDDGNMDDDSIQFCKDIATENGCELCMKWCVAMAAMDEISRYDWYDLYHDRELP